MLVAALITQAAGTAAAGGAYGADTGISWWQTLGGLIVVFGLLLVSLKLLGRWNRTRAGADSSLLTVWHLGPKREIQLLRLGNEVHYVYRHDGAMVLLKKEKLGEYEMKQQAAAAG